MDQLNTNLEMRQIACIDYRYRAYRNKIIPYLPCGIFTTHFFNRIYVLFNHTILPQKKACMNSYIQTLAIYYNNYQSNNIDLANDYGNLLSRTTAMIEKFLGGVVAPGSEGTDFDAELLELAAQTPEAMAKYMDKVDVANAIGEVWKLVAKANKYIDDTAPWTLNKNGGADGGL